MKPQKMMPPPGGRIGRMLPGLARFLRRLKEHELSQRWHSSKTKKEETIGKKAELELRRKIGEGRDYQLVRKQRMEERERKRSADRFRRFIQRMVPLEDGPTRIAKEGVT